MVETLKYDTNMKKTMKYSLLPLACLLLLAGCRKNYEEVEEVNFGVSLRSATFKVGEPVRFDFSGNPDFISFYSGERGNDYAYKDKDRIVETEMTFSFTATTASGTAGYPNPARVPVCYSSDFSGEYTEEAVRAATWVEITDRFTMPTDTGKTDVLSGDANIAEFFPDDETPLYFCFHYIVEAFDATAAEGKGNGRTQWTFKQTKFNGVAGESTTTLYDFQSASWKIVSAASYEGSTSLPDVNASRILLRSEFQPPIDRECWAVSGPIAKMNYINDGPDKGVGIKAMAEATLRSYEHTYTQPGEYTVTFVAANASVYGRKEVVRSMTIEIVEDEGGIEQPQPGEWNR